MAGLALLRCVDGHSQWSWLFRGGPLDRLRGAALLDPEVAQHTHAVRIPAAVGQQDIRLLLAAAEHHKAESPATVGSSSNVEGKLYLHHNGCDHTIQHIVNAIEALVRRTDAENWGLLADSKVMADGPMMPRCVEFHEYNVCGRQQCDSHYDAGSLFTADIMLSEAGDFEGGEMVTTASAADGTEQRTPHTFMRGDCLVFLSHKAHSVSRLQSGRRTVLVIEFWQGGTCVANHRCCDGGVRQDVLCGHHEGAATYFSRYARDAEEPAPEQRSEPGMPRVGTNDTSATRDKLVGPAAATTGTLSAKPGTQAAGDERGGAAADGVGAAVKRMDAPPSLHRRRELHELVVARGGHAPPAWWQSAGVGAEVADQLASKHFCVLNDFLSGDACSALLEEVRTARRAGRLQAAAATVGEGKMHAQSEEHRQPTLRNDLVGWFTGTEPGFRMLPAYLETVDHFVGGLRQSGVPAAAQLRGCLQRSRAMAACYPGDGARYARHCDNACQSGVGDMCNGRRLVRKCQCPNAAPKLSQLTAEPLTVNHRPCLLAPVCPESRSSTI